MTFPSFFDDAPVISMHDPLADLLGAAEGGVIEYCYADAVRLAGHSCPTVAGAYLSVRAALNVLYPDSLPERGGIAVHMPSPETEGTIGVVAQVITLLTGATALGGFKGIGDRFARNGLLSFARNSDENDGAVRFERLDSGAAVGVIFAGYPRMLPSANACRRSYRTARRPNNRSNLRVSGRRVCARCCWSTPMIRRWFASSRLADRVLNAGWPSGLKLQPLRQLWQRQETTNFYLMFTQS